VDPNDEHHILRLRDKFIQKGHLCLVFELLSVNLYELIKQNQYRGLGLNLVRVFAGQLLDAMSMLKDAHIIHCDLKPENILLTAYALILIDLIIVRKVQPSKSWISEVRAMNDIQCLLTSNLASIGPQKSCLGCLIQPPLICGLWGVSRLNYSLVCLYSPEVPNIIKYVASSRCLGTTLWFVANAECRRIG
jgi:serine/threonine protein kinase